MDFTIFYCADFHALVVDKNIDTKLIELEFELSMIACHDGPELIHQFCEDTEDLALIASGLSEYQEAMQLNNSRKNI